MERVISVARPLAAVLVMVAAVACGRDGTSRDATAGPYSAQLAEAIPRIEQAIGLEFREPPRVEVRSRREVLDFLERRVREERTERELRGIQLLYARLGLIPDTLDLRAFLLDLLLEQVVGYYDPQARVLYVVEGAPPEQAGTVLYHELVHALQDQYIDLDSIQRIESDSDRQMAAQAIIEGQATLKSLEAMLGRDVFARLPGGWDRLRQQIREQSSAMPIFATAPLIIQESLIFPYLNGAEFVRRFEERRPGESLLGDAMPSATSHILRAETYFGERRLEPLHVELPAPRAGRVVHQDNMGEFLIRVLLFDHLRNQPEAIRSAAGWRGDRYMVLETQGEDAVVWLTLWATQDDANEFATSLGRIPRHRYQDVTEAFTGVGARRFTADGRRALELRTVEIAGHPAVLFVDAPGATGVDLIDVARVRVR